MEGENINTIEDAFAYEIYMAAALNSSQEKPTNNLHFSPSIFQHKDVSGKNEKAKSGHRYQTKEREKTTKPLYSLIFISNHASVNPQYDESQLT